MSFSNSDLNALRLAREERQKKRLKGEPVTHNDETQQFPHVEPICREAQEEIEKEIDSEDETGLVIVEEDEESDDEVVSLASPSKSDFNPLHLARDERLVVGKKRPKSEPVTNNEAGQSSHVGQPICKKARQEEKGKEKDYEDEAGLVGDFISKKRLISPLLETLTEFSSLLKELKEPIKLLRDLLGENFEAYQANRGNDSKDLPIVEKFNPLFNSIIALNLNEAYSKVDLSLPPFIKLGLCKLEQAKAENDEHQEKTYDTQLDEYNRLKSLLRLLNKIDEMKRVLPDEINKLNGSEERNEGSPISLAVIKLDNEADTKVDSDDARQPIAQGDLPLEIWEMILKNCTGPDLIALKNVNRLANRFFNQCYLLEKLKIRYAHWYYQYEYEKIIAEDEGERRCEFRFAYDSDIDHDISYGDIYLWVLNEYLGKEIFLKIEYFNQINASTHILTKSLLNDLSIRKKFYESTIYIHLVNRNYLFLLSILMRLMRQSGNITFIINALEMLVTEKWGCSSAKAHRGGSKAKAFDVQQTQEQIQAQEMKDFKLFVEFFPYLDKWPDSQLRILTEALTYAKKESIIKYIIDNYPHFLSNTGRSGRYPIFLLFGSHKTGIRVRLINYIMEKSSPDLHREYIIFLLTARHNYKNLRNLIIDKFTFEVFFSIAKGWGFKDLPGNNHLHNELKSKSSNIQYILYAIVQSKYCLNNLMLRGLPQDWNEKKLSDVAYLIKHGHELLIAAFRGCDFDKEFLVEKIKSYLKSKLTTEQFKQLLDNVLKAKKEDILKKEQLVNQENIRKIIQRKQVEDASEQLFREVAQEDLASKEMNPINGGVHREVTQPLLLNAEIGVVNSNTVTAAQMVGETSDAIREQTERLLFLELEIDFANSQMATVATSTVTFFNRANSTPPNHASLDKTCALPAGYRF